MFSHLFYIRIRFEIFQQEISSSIHSRRLGKAVRKKGTRHAIQYTLNNRAWLILCFYLASKCCIFSFENGDVRGERYPIFWLLTLFGILTRDFFSELVILAILWYLRCSIMATECLAYRIACSCLIGICEISIF